MGHKCARTHSSDDEPPLPASPGAVGRRAMSPDGQEPTAEQPVRRLSVLHNAAFLVLAQVTTTALSIIMSAFLGRWLGAGDFGTLFLVTSNITLAYVFVDWGQLGYLVGAIAQERGRSSELLGSALVLRVALALVTSSALAGIAQLLNYGAPVARLVALMAVTFLPTTMVNAISLVLRGHERMDLEAGTTMAAAVLNSSLTICVVLLGGRLPAIIAAGGIAGLFALALAVRNLRRLSLPAPSVTARALRDLLLGGGPFLVLNVALAAHPYVDATILAKLAPATSVGWFGGANRILGTLIFPAGVFGSACYPMLSRIAASEPARFGPVARSAIRPMIVLGVLAAAGTYLFADVGVSLVYSRARFGPSIAVLQAFAPYPLLVFINMVLGYTLLANRGGRRSVFTAAKIGALLLGAWLDLLLVPHFQARYGNGGIGIALSCGASEIVMTIAAVALMPSQTLDRTVAGVFARSLCAAAAMLAAGILLSHTPLAVRLIVCLGTFAAAAVALRLIGRDDLEMMRNAIRVRRGAAIAQPGAQ